MKNKMLKVLLILICFKSFGQDSLQIEKLRSQIFSLSPIAKNVNKVNGLCFGIGHFENRLIEKQTINGLNLEANPSGILVPYLVMVYSGTKDSLNIGNFNFDEKAKIKVNGINISTGGFFESSEVNGLNVSAFAGFNTINGVSISILNGTNKANGLQIALWNQANALKGIQIGVYNKSNYSVGLQVGIVNISNKTKGLQLGLVNINKKRFLPFINF